MDKLTLLQMIKKALENKNKVYNPIVVKYMVFLSQYDGWVVSKKKDKSPTVTRVKSEATGFELTQAQLMRDDCLYLGRVDVELQG